MKERISDFFAYLQVMKKASPETLRAYAADLKECYSILPEGAITKEGVRAYVEYLGKKGYKRSTVLRKLSSFRSFSAFAYKKKWLKEDPKRYLYRMKREKSLPRAVSYEEVQQLFSQPDTTSYFGLRDRSIMELLYSSALRIAELAKLNIQDLFLEKRRILVRGKGKKERLLPITDTAACWLKTYVEDPRRLQDTKEHKKMRDQSAVFLNKWGNRLHMRSIHRSFCLYLQASGLSASITPHTLRHSIATHWLEKGMDIKPIQKILGQDSVKTTTIYT